MSLCTQMINFIPTLFPSIVLAFFISLLVVVFAYYISQFLQNPKISLWAKTELLQIFISAVFILLILHLINVSCQLTTSSLEEIINLTASPPQNQSLLEASLIYLKNTANYAHRAFLYTRYVMGKVNVAESYSIWKCAIPLCFFTQGGTGSSSAPISGSSYFYSGLFAAFNVSFFAFFYSMMHIAFLEYIHSGFFLFLLPIAIIFRSLPFMRTVGSLFISIIFNFIVTYLLLFSAVSLVISVPPLPPSVNEGSLKVSGGFWSWFTGSGITATPVSGEEVSSSFIFAATSFVYATFIPSLILLATLASTAYMAKLLGEEIDLSRIMQMI